MKQLREVEEAKALMNEAMVWSVMKWLRDKKSVRRTADRANNALWSMQKAVRSSWPLELQRAYEELENGGGASRNGTVTPEIKSWLKRVKEAEDEAYNAHLAAEETFAKAEKILSTSMAREGCKKAIYSWELYEIAIDAAEAKVSSKASR